MLGGLLLTGVLALALAKKILRLFSTIKFWSFYYTGTIRPTSTAGHVKKTVFGLIAWWAAVCGVACSCSGEKDFAVIFDHLVVLVVTGMILVIIKPIAMVYNHVRLSLLQGICRWIHTFPPHTLRHHLESIFSFHYTGTIYFPRAPLPAREKHVFSSDQYE